MFWFFRLRTRHLKEGVLVSHAIIYFNDETPKVKNFVFSSSKFDDFLYFGLNFNKQTAGGTTDSRVS